MKSLFLEVRREPINVGNVEDQPPPSGSGVAVFLIEDRVLSVFRAERGKIAIFVPVDDLHAEQIPIEPQRDRHTGHPKCDCGNLLDIHVHLQAPPAAPLQLYKHAATHHRGLASSKKRTAEIFSASSV